jgi:hypothetical protein
VAPRAATTMRVGSGVAAPRQAMPSDTAISLARLARSTSWGKHATHTPMPSAMGLPFREEVCTRCIEELSAELTSLEARRSELAEEISKSQPSVPEPEELAVLVEDIERAMRDGALPERKAVMQARSRRSGSGIAATSSRSSASRFLDHRLETATQLEAARAVLRGRWNPLPPGHAAEWFTVAEKCLQILKGVRIVSP